MFSLGDGDSYTFIHYEVIKYFVLYKLINITLLIYTVQYEVIKPQEAIIDLSINSSLNKIKVLLM